MLNIFYFLLCIMTNKRTILHLLVIIQDNKRFTVQELKLKCLIYCCNFCKFTTPVSGRTNDALSQKPNYLAVLFVVVSCLLRYLAMVATESLRQDHFCSTSN